MNGAVKNKTRTSKGKTEGNVTVSPCVPEAMAGLLKGLNSACLLSVTVHGFPVPSSPCLVGVRVRMCEQVSVGVCDWGWFAPAESHHRWAISVPVTLSPLSDPCSVCGRRLRSVLVPRFLSPAASWTPITGPLAAHCFPALPASALRRAPFLPTESSASALRRAPFLSTKSSTFSSRCVLLLVINSLFRNWILPSSLWQKDLTIFMDSAETRGLQELISGNNARMDLQEENMLNTGRAVQALVAQVSELTTQVQLLRSPAAPPTPPSFSIPGNHSPQHEPRLPGAGDVCRRS